MLTSYCGPRWFRSCCHIHVASIQKVVVLWVGLVHPIHTHSSPKCVPDFGQIWAIVRRVWTVLGDNMVVQDGQNHVATSMLYPYNILVSLWWCGLASNTLDIPIPSLSTVAQIWAQESGLLPSGSRVCWPDIVVIYVPGHVNISMLHQYKAFYKLMVLWNRLLHPLHTHSSPEYVPDFGQIWVIVGRVETTVKYHQVSYQYSSCPTFLILG